MDDNGHKSRPEYMVPEYMVHLVYRPFPVSGGDAGEKKPAAMTPTASTPAPLVRRAPPLPIVIDPGLVPTAPALSMLIIDRAVFKRAVPPTSTVDDARMDEYRPMPFDGLIRLLLEAPVDNPLSAELFLR